jgi:hypothetical protein
MISQHVKNAVHILVSGNAVSVERLSSICRSDCGGAQRIVGAFEEENSKPVPVELAEEIRLQLRGAALVRQVLSTHLSSTGEQIIAYDTDSDDSDPQPEVAVAAGSKVVETFAVSELADWGGGFVRFQMGYSDE